MVDHENSNQLRFEPRIPLPLSHWISCCCKMDVNILRIEFKPRQWLDSTHKTYSMLYSNITWMYTSIVRYTISLRSPQVRIPNCSLYHYDVTITPDKCPRRVNREIIEALVNTHKEYFGQQKPVFDGRKNLYSRKSLPIGRDRVSYMYVV